MLRRFMGISTELWWVLCFLTGTRKGPSTPLTRSAIRGITLLYLMIQLIILQIMMAIALPQWDAWVQREKELELIWRGEQYVQAIQYYMLKFRTYPPNVEIMVQQHFLRKAYPEPFHPEGKWNLLTQASLARQKSAPGAQPGTQPPPSTSPTRGGSGPIVSGPLIGVASMDEGESIVVYKNQRQHNLWLFVYQPQTPTGNQPQPSINPPTPRPRKQQGGSS